MRKAHTLQAPARRTLFMDVLFKEFVVQGKERVAPFELGQDFASIILLSSATSHPATTKTRRIHPHQATQAHFNQIVIMQLGAYNPAIESHVYTKFHPLL